MANSKEFIMVTQIFASKSPTLKRERALEQDTIVLTLNQALPNISAAKIGKINKLYEI
jgi:hypothetical protein